MPLRLVGHGVGFALVNQVLLLLSAGRRRYHQREPILSTDLHDFLRRLQHGDGFVDVDHLELVFD